MTQQHVPCYDHDHVEMNSLLYSEHENYFEFFHAYNFRFFRNYVYPE